MIIGDFFPTPIGYNPLSRNLYKSEIDFINNERKNVMLNGGNFASLNKYILDKDELKDLKTLLTKNVNEYFKNVFEPEKDVELYITNSWLNWTENEQFHHQHSHPNSLISGVFYIDVVCGDTINFFNPNRFFGNIKIKGEDSGKWNSKEWKWPVDKNHLLVFPSTLDHRVCNRPTGFSGTRVSLAFNTWFKGCLGSEDYVCMVQN